MDVKEDSGLKYLTGKFHKQIWKNDKLLFEEKTLTGHPGMKLSDFENGTSKSYYSYLYDNHDRDLLIEIEKNDGNIKWELRLDYNTRILLHREDGRVHGRIRGDNGDSAELRFSKSGETFVLYEGSLYMNEYKVYLNTNGIPIEVSCYKSSFDGKRGIYGNTFEFDEEGNLLSIIRREDKSNKQIPSSVTRFKELLEKFDSKGNLIEFIREIDGDFIRMEKDGEKVKFSLSREDEDKVTVEPYFLENGDFSYKFESGNKDMYHYYLFYPNGQFKTVSMKDSYYLREAGYHPNGDTYYFMMENKFYKVIEKFEDISVRPARMTDSETIRK